MYIYLHNYTYVYYVFHVELFLKEQMVQCSMSGPLTIKNLNYDLMVAQNMLRKNEVKWGFFSENKWI